MSALRGAARGGLQLLNTRTGWAAQQSSGFTSLTLGSWWQGTSSAAAAPSGALGWQRVTALLPSALADLQWLAAPKKKVCPSTGFAAAPAPVFCQTAVPGWQACAIGIGSRGVQCSPSRASPAAAAAATGAAAGLASTAGLWLSNPCKAAPQHADASDADACRPTLPACVHPHPPHLCRCHRTGRASAALTSSSGLCQLCRSAASASASSTSTQCPPSVKRRSALPSTCGHGQTHSAACTCVQQRDESFCCRLSPAPACLRRCWQLHAALCLLYLSRHPMLFPTSPAFVPCLLAIR